eukprot:3875028-Pyramimonas_sp.AAC.1
MRSSAAALGLMPTICSHAQRPVQFLRKIILYETPRSAARVSGIGSSARPMFTTVAPFSKEQQR